MGNFKLSVQTNIKTDENYSYSAYLVSPTEKSITELLASKTAGAAPTELQPLVVNHCLTGPHPCCTQPQPVSTQATYNRMVFIVQNQVSCNSQVYVLTFDMDTTQRPVITEIQYLHTVLGIASQNNANCSNAAYPWLGLTKDYPIDEAVYIKTLCVEQNGINVTLAAQKLLPKTQTAVKGNPCAPASMKAQCNTNNDCSCKPEAA